MTSLRIGLSMTVCYEPYQSFGMQDRNDSEKPTCLQLIRYFDDCGHLWSFTPGMAVCAESRPASPPDGDQVFRRWPAGLANRRPFDSSSRAR
jgi:hypothetical protein